MGPGITVRWDRVIGGENKTYAAKTAFIVPASKVSDDGASHWEALGISSATLPSRFSNQEGKQDTPSRNPTGKTSCLA